MRALRDRRTAGAIALRAGQRQIVRTRSAAVREACRLWVVNTPPACIVCSGPIAGPLARLGSTTCHDHRGSFA